jgi:hypothetical protein
LTFDPDTNKHTNKQTNTQTNKQTIFFHKTLPTVEGIINL